MNAARDKTQRLFSLLADGELSDAEAAQFNERLKADPDVRRAYLEYMKLHALLQWEHGDIEEGAQATTLPVATTASHTWIAGTAIVAIAALTLLIFVLRPPPDSGLVRDADQVGAPYSVVAEAKAALWESRGRSDEKSGQSYVLTSGTARLDLGSGGWVAMVGPCDLEVLGPNRVQLNSGRITASSSASADSIHVLVDAIDFAAKRAEFGVDVDSDHLVELHSLSGTVNARMGEAGSDGDFTIVQGDARLFDCVSGHGRRIRFSLTRFPRRWATQPEGPEILGAVRFATRMPKSLVEGAIENAQNVYLFPESTSTAVDSEVVAITGSRVVRGDRHERVQRAVPEGTIVDSYLIHFDPVDSTAANRNPISGTIAFDRPIVGLIVGQRELEQTDALLGDPNTTYEPGSRTGRAAGKHPVGKWSMILKGRHEMMFGLGEATGVYEIRILVEPKSDQEDNSAGSVKMEIERDK